TGSPDIAEVLKEADAALTEGDVETAAAIFSEVLRAAHTNLAAVARLARCHLAAEDVEKAKQTLALVPEAKRSDAAVKAVQAAHELVAQAESVGPAAELESKVAANPLDHQARFDL